MYLSIRVIISFLFLNLFLLWLDYSRLFFFKSILAVLWLLRLLRVFKLAKQWKQLRIIVEALLHGFKSMIYISFILFLFFYVYAIVGKWIVGLIFF
jgi:hypothetical protein